MYDGAIHLPDLSEPGAVTLPFKNEFQNGLEPVPSVEKEKRIGIDALEEQADKVI
jgi:hypothetical protein